MKIQPPLKVVREWENDLHMPRAKPTSQNVNSVEEKFSPTLNRKLHLSERWKKSQNLILQQRYP